MFHDVDLLPEDDRILYTCPPQPKHLAVGQDRFDYKILWHDYFGGVSAMSVQHFNFVNGFSNQYWGWGSEDDDMSFRLKKNDLTVLRDEPEIAR